MQAKYSIWKLDEKKYLKITPLFMYESAFNHKLIPCDNETEMKCLKTPKSSM